MQFSYKTLLLTGALLTTLPIAYAAEEAEPFSFSANVAFTSDYVWRGLTQTDEGWAIQGGFDANHKSGFYAGTWASNVNFLDNSTDAVTEEADLEIDVYLGYGGELDNGFSYDLGVGRYIFPGAHCYLHYYFNEFILGLGYALPMGTEFGVSYNFSPEFTGYVGRAHHYMFEASHSLENGLGVSGHVGRQTFKDNPGDNYSYYGAALSYTINDFELSLNYSDTNEEQGKDAEERVFVTLSKEL